jgi:hypothetical protein
MNPGGTMTAEEIVITTRSAGSTARFFTGQVEFIEIGTWRAQTSFSIAESIEHVLALRNDIQPRFWGVDMDPEAEKWWNKRIKHVKWSGLDLRFITAVDSSAIDKVKSVCGQIHWCLIDACHCFECTRDNINAWGEIMVPGGQLAIHDTSPTRDSPKYQKRRRQHWRTRTWGVTKAVRESEMLKKDFTLLEETVMNSGIQIWRKND